MIDIHSHICFGIDDGSKSIEESIELLKVMSEEGITDLFLTPHYVIGTDYNANNEVKRTIYSLLVDACKKEKININLHLGNEVYIDDKISKYIDNEEIMTMNDDTSYILLEFSLFQYNPNYKLIIHNLLTKGYNIIIAHPERYIYIDRNMQLIKELREMGVFFQGNYLSLFDKYGKEAKKQLKVMLKRKYIDFLGTDMHHMEKLYGKELEKALYKITKDKEYVKDLLYKNASDFLL